MTALSVRLSMQPESKFGWLAARYGAEQAQARLRWLDAGSLYAQFASGRNLAIDVMVIVLIPRRRRRSWPTSC